MDQRMKNLVVFTFSWISCFIELIMNFVATHFILRSAGRKACEYGLRASQKVGLACQFHPFVYKHCFLRYNPSVTIFV